MRVSQILVSATAALLLAGCGQRGPLYLPTGEDAAHRASLPQTLRPSPGAAPASAPPESTTPASTAPATRVTTPPTGTAQPIRNR